MIVPKQILFKLMLFYLWNYRDLFCKKKDFKKTKLTKKGTRPTWESCKDIRLFTSDPYLIPKHTLDIRVRLTCPRTWRRQSLCSPCYTSPWVCKYLQSSHTWQSHYESLSHWWKPYFSKRYSRSPIVVRLETPSTFTLTILKFKT